MNYTKGEWKVEFGTHNGYDAMTSGYEVSCGGKEIAMLDTCSYENTKPDPEYGDGHGESNEAKANAHLIASSPKQNEALIWVAEWLGIRQPNGEKPNRADVVRIVKEALAKAEGK